MIRLVYQNDTSVPRIQVIHVMNVPDNRQLLSHPFTSSTRSLQLQRHNFGVIWNEIYVSHNKFKIFRDKFTSGEGWRRFLVLSVVLCRPVS